MVGRRTVVALLAAAVLVAACSELPRDPAGTLERARGGTLRVGLVEGAHPEEVELVRSFAASIDARVDWVRAGAEETLERLERRELAIVVAGLTMKTPWKSRVALTRPWSEAGGEKRVLATAPGENALLVALERHIQGRR